MKHVICAYMTMAIWMFSLTVSSATSLPYEYEHTWHHFYNQDGGYSYSVDIYPSLAEDRDISLNEYFYRVYDSVSGRMSFRESVAQEQTERYQAYYEAAPTHVYYTVQYWIGFKNQAGGYTLEKVSVDLLRNKYRCIKYKYYSWDKKQKRYDVQSSGAMSLWKDIEDDYTVQHSLEYLQTNKKGVFSKMS